ncbi:MAG: alpha/beta fold hydrolase [Geminicoccaceae bacterium]|nr:MAG: alpha/beta fold hydrolase [Geminicoccaceae bacterium]
MTDRIPLVLLPGLGCDERLWAHAAAHLADMADVQVPGILDGTHVAEMAASVLAAAPPSFALAGLSMGGYVAMEIMRRAPSRVFRLALLDTKADLDPPEVKAARHEALRDIDAGRFDAHIDGRLSALLGPAALTQPGPVELVRSMAETVGADRYSRQMHAIMSRPDSLASLAEIACPTLVLCGREDVLTPPEAHARMAEAIPRARLALIEQCGHLAPIEQPQAVTALLRDWLCYRR